MGRWLRTVRAAHNLKQDEFADRIGQGRSSIAMYETGGRAVPDEVIREIVRKFPDSPTPPPLGDRAKSDASLDDGRLVSLAGHKLQPIPVVGDVEAGAGAYTVDPEAHEVHVPESLARIGGLGWFIKGDSMMPDLEPGMIAVFREWRQTKPRYTFLLRTPEGGLRVKNLVYHNSDGMWWMHSINPTYEPEPLGKHEILGFLVGWYRVMGKRETMDSDPDGLLLGARLQ